MFASFSRLPFLCLVSIEKLKFREKKKRKASVPRLWGMEFDFQLKIIIDRE